MTDRTGYNSAFVHALQRLNPAQKEAVEHIDGPVLVIAGPGTGKTHILSARIGRILLDTDTQPNNILCLTFTDAGVQAMRQRLLQWIGPEAHRVHIFTFHAFCNHIIQNNLELFGRRELEPVSELEQIEIIQQIIDELPYQHPLKRGRTGDPYFYVSHLKDLFQKIKSENWPLDYFSRQIEAYIDDLPNRREFVYQVNRGKIKKGELKRKVYEEAVDRMEKLTAAAGLFPRYEALLQQTGRYDYHDMIRWVLDAFEQHEYLLRNYQEKYLYFLVDEYQDTNGAQNAIIHKLIDYWDRPNIFIVGDDDQSIYEFQGARLKNLEDFYATYRDELKVVVLEENYRSAQTILDSSGRLIRQNEKRIIHHLEALGLQKVLTARNAEFAHLPAPPQIVQYPSRLQETVDIADTLEQLWKSGFPLEEAAVIYARHKQAEPLMALLERRGIPYQTKREVNILETILVQQIRAIAAFLEAEGRQPFSGEAHLFQLLHFDCWEIDKYDLAKMAALISAETTWRDAMHQPEMLRGWHLRKPEMLEQAGLILDDLIGQAYNQPVPALLERLINRSGILNWALRQDDRVWWLQVLHTLVHFTQAEAQRQPQLSLSRWLEILEKMERHRLSIEVNRSIQAPQGIQLLTAHSSKGLEFRRVYMIDCVQDQWEPRNRRGSYQFTFPDTLTFSGEEDAEESRRRLFYVGMTRAKEYLQLSYSILDQSEKPLMRTFFIDELFDGPAPEAQLKSATPENMLLAQILMLQEQQPSQSAVLEDAVIGQLLEGFSMSITSLNRYLRCPLSFYYEDVLKVPTLPSEASIFGTAVHHTLQQSSEWILRHQGNTPSPRQVVSWFEQTMQRCQSQLAPSAYQHRLERGRHALRLYAEQEMPRWHTQLKVEQVIADAVVDGVPLRGVIDKIELFDGFVRVIDYKTGSQDDKKLKPPSDKDPQGGNYWRQLAFYKLLYESSQSAPGKVQSGIIVFVEPDYRGRFVHSEHQFEAADMEQMRFLITDTYAHIQRHEFSKGCGEPYCVWCNFTRLRERPASFADEEIESLDD